MATQDLMAAISRIQEQRHHNGKTILDEILSSNLSAFEKRPARLLEEAQTLAGAGTETTALILSVRLPLITQVRKY